MLLLLLLLLQCPSRADDVSSSTCRHKLYFGKPSVKRIVGCNKLFCFQNFTNQKQFVWISVIWLDISVYDISIFSKVDQDDFFFFLAISLIFLICGCTHLEYTKIISCIFFFNLWVHIFTMHQDDSFTSLNLWVCYLLYIKISFI